MYVRFSGRGQYGMESFQHGMETDGRINDDIPQFDRHLFRDQVYNLKRKEREFRKWPKLLVDVFSIPLINFSSEDNLVSERSGDCSPEQSRYRSSVWEWVREQEEKNPVSDHTGMAGEKKPIFTFI